MISEHISNDIRPRMKILNMVIPILMHYYNFPFKKTAKMYFIAPFRPAAASCKKPLASCIYSLANQWKATLSNVVGFPTVYHRIYCCKFMTLSNQTRRVAFASALEYHFKRVCKICLCMHEVFIDRGIHKHGYTAIQYSPITAIIGFLSFTHNSNISEI